MYRECFCGGNVQSHFLVSLLLRFLPNINSIEYMYFRFFFSLHKKFNFVGSCAMHYCGTAELSFYCGCIFSCCSKFNRIQFLDFEQMASNILFSNFFSSYACHYGAGSGLSQYLLLFSNGIFVYFPFFFAHFMYSRLDICIRKNRFCALNSCWVCELKIFIHSYISHTHRPAKTNNWSI